MAIRRSPLTAGRGQGPGPDRGVVRPVEVEDHAVDASSVTGFGWARLTAWTTSSSVSVTAVSCPLCKTPRVAMMHPAFVDGEALLGLCG
jgi:hypothetical protein